MRRFLTLAVLALFTALEVAAVLALKAAVGTAGALLVLCLDVLAGLFVMSWGARSKPPQRGWRVAAGGVIAIPGLVLDLVGLALLIPLVQQWLGAHAERGTQEWLRRNHMSVITVTDVGGVQRTTVVNGDVITGEVIDDPGSGSAGAGETGPASGGGRVIRGEIQGGDPA